MDILETRDTLVERLRGAGLRVVTDQRDANPPCLLVMPDQLAMSLGGVYGATYSVAFIAPDIGYDRAHALLVNLIEQASEVVALGETIRTSTLTLSGSAPLPAYIATIEA